MHISHRQRQGENLNAEGRTQVTPTLDSGSCNWRAMACPSMLPRGSRQKLSLLTPTLTNILLLILQLEESQDICVEKWVCVLGGAEVGSTTENMSKYSLWILFFTFTPCLRQGLFATVQTGLASPRESGDSLISTFHFS